MFIVIPFVFLSVISLSVLFFIIFIFMERDFFYYFYSFLYSKGSQLMVNTNKQVNKGGCISVSSSEIDILWPLILLCLSLEPS